MSEQDRMTPAGVLLGSLAGFLVAALSMAAAAGWMARQALPATAAGMLATAAVCIGGWAGGVTAALLQKAKGVLAGLLEGGILAAALCLLQLASGGTIERLGLFRMAAVLLCGGLGGAFGRVLSEKKRHL